MLVFISYSRYDREFALRLRTALRDWGYDTWLDVENIPKGAKWPDEIDRGLKAAAVIVGVLSENSMRSGNVKNEWDWALEYDKPLILLRIAPCQVSHRYVRINYIDCVGDEAAGLAELHTALVNPRPPFIEAAATYPTPKPEKRDPVNNRGRLLHNVHEFWIKGVLAPAKLGDIWLDLPAGQRSDAVQPTIPRNVHHPDFESFALGSGVPVGDVFNRLGKELLILGEPGSGKTITLLELAQTLIARAEADSTLPVPVVLNLASWAEKQPPFENWLIERLNLEYSVPRRLGRRWIENGKLLFLLDGLDEVRRECRDDCVTAINDFWRDYDYVDNGIAVCSRVHDYDDLTARLHLDHAIVLNALDPAQADAYLDKLGPRWDHLRAALNENEVLQEFAESPLLLNIMAVAYRDLLESDITGFANADDQQAHLFDCYTARCLQGNEHRHYTHTKTQRWLAWLAGRLFEHGQTVFHIEDLQPDWLDEVQRNHYGWTAGLISGLVVGLVFGLAFILISGLRVVLVFGLVFGLVSGLLGGLSGMVGEEIHVVDGLRWSWSQARIGLVFGLLAGLVVGLDSGPVSGLLVGLFIGLIFGLDSNQVELRTRPNQGIWRSLQNTTIVSMIFGLVIGLISGLLIVDPYVEELRAHTELTWSWSNAEAGLAFGIFFGLFFGLFGGIMSQDNNMSSRVRLIDNGALAVFQHTALRLVLWRVGVAPLNYADFLAYCEERHLLRRAGGGYLFRHRLLMEHIAGSPASPGHE